MTCIDQFFDHAEKESNDEGRINQVETLFQLRDFFFFFKCDLDLILLVIPGRVA